MPFDWRAARWLTGVPPEAFDRIAREGLVPPKPGQQRLRFSDASHPQPLGINCSPVYEVASACAGNFATGAEGWVLCFKMPCEPTPVEGELAAWYVSQAVHADQVRVYDRYRSGNCRPIREEAVGLARLQGTSDTREASP